MKNVKKRYEGCKKFRRPENLLLTLTHCEGVYFPQVQGQ